MSAVLRGLRAFGAFWWDFVVGDDWRVAVGVVLAIVVTGVLAHTRRAGVVAAARRGARGAGALAPFGGPRRASLGGHRRQFDRADAVGVGEDRDLDDPSALDREAGDRERLAVEIAEHPGLAVDEHRDRHERGVRERQCLGRDLRRAADQASEVSRSRVRAQHDVRVEHGEQRVEVPGARRRQERVDELALTRAVGVGGAR